MAEASITIRESFATSGYVLLPGFLAPNELGLFEDAVGRVLSVPPHPGMSRPGNDLSPLRWNDEIVAMVLRSRQRMRRIRDATSASDLKWLSGYVSTKRPHTPSLCWHQDWWCWDHPISFEKLAPQVAVLIYLSKTTPHNGALRVLPGSHHRHSELHTILPEPHSPSANSLGRDHQAMSDRPEQVTLNLRAGDAVAIDYRLLHGTHANETSARRDCVLLSFFPNWNVLPIELKAHVSAHPALPTDYEIADLFRTTYADLVPRFEGPPVDIRINRVPPPSFAMTSAVGPQQLSKDGCISR